MPGHNLGTAEVEAALTEHPAVAEAAVVGIPHDVKGNCLYCYVTLKQGQEGSEAMAKELKTIVRRRCRFVHACRHHAPGLSFHHI